MKTFLLLCIAFLPLNAQHFGDKAPSIPDTYVTSHPRLPHPDDTYLTALFGNAAYSRFSAEANSWNNASPGQIWQCRYMLIAYRADKVVNPGGSSNQTAWLAKIKALGSVADLQQAACQAMAFDWVYNDLDGTSRTNYLTQMNSYSGSFESNWNSTSSPYNDVAYCDGVAHGVWFGLVQYPDAGATGLAHLRFALDVLTNIQMPVWKQQFSRQGIGTSDADTDNGGSWSEGLSDYFVCTTGPGMNQWIGPDLWAWANASGQGTSFFTATNPWLLNIAYWPMYTVRPDFTPSRIGQVSYGVYQPEYTVDIAAGFHATPGTFEMFAEIYNATTVRQWNRTTIWGGATPDGWEPSGYPFYTPDSSSHTATPLSTLAPVKNFPGSGTIYLRTGWTEDDAMFTVRYGAGFWSHPTQDAGAYQSYKNGTLTQHNGTYRAGAFCQHQLYTASAASHNTLLVTDPADVYSDEVFDTCFASGNSFVALANDGGQKRTGSNYSNRGGLANLMQSPADIAQWTRARDWYETGTLVAYVVRPAYTYIAIDLTAAYNDTGSGITGVTAHTAPFQQFEPNSVNRTRRVQKFIRHFLFIPRGHTAHWIVYDQVITTNSSFVKTNVIHTMNQPVTSTYTGGKTYVVTRADLVDATPTTCAAWLGSWGGNLTHDSGTCAGSNAKYQYSGKMYGALPDFPGATVSSATVLGGPGSEFIISGTNYDQCAGGGTQCPANVFGSNTINHVNGDSTHGTTELGSYRIEEVPGSASKEDWFLNWQLTTDTTSDASTPFSANPVITSTGTSCVEGSNCDWTVTATESTCTIVPVFPKRGVGGHLTISGAGCAGKGITTVNEDFIAQESGIDIPVNTWVQVTAANGFYNPMAPYVPGYDYCGYAPVLDQQICQFGFREITGEIQRAIFGYDFAQNRLNILDHESFFHTESQPTGGHPDQNAQIDPVFSIYVGARNNSASRSAEGQATTYWWDAAALAGRNKQAELAPNANNAVIATGAFAPLRRQAVFEGGISFGGFGELLLGNSSASNTTNKGITCTSNASNCPSPQSQANSMATRAADQCQYQMGSGTNPAGGFYKYCNGTSSAITASGTAPTNVDGAIMVWDDEEDKMFLIGGQVGAGGTIIPDTWAYDPVANTWAHLLSTGLPSQASYGLFQRGALFPRWGVIAIWGFTDGTSTTSSPANTPLYLYRYRSGSKAGWLSSVPYKASPGSLNRNGTGQTDSTNSMAHKVAVAVASGTVYTLDVETGANTTTNLGRFLYPYGQSISSGVSNNMGTGFNAIANKDTANGSSSDDPSVTVSGSPAVPYACWTEQVWGGQNSATVTVKSFSAGSWGSTWGTNGRVGSAGGGSSQGLCRIIDVGGTPHLIFIENAYPGGSSFTNNVFVYKISGGAYSALGGALNIGGAGTTFVDAVDIASTGSAPVAVWNEYQQNNTIGVPGNISQVYAKQWTGSAWSPLCGGTALNGGSGRNSYGAITWLGGKPYVAYVHRTADLAGTAQLKIQTCTSGSWVDVYSGHAEKDQSNGWVLRPRIDNDGTDLYLAWAEMGNPAPWMTNQEWDLSLAERPQIFAAKLTTGGTLTYLGGSLNADPSAGSAQYPSLAMNGSNPVVSWRETKLGTMGQAYAKAWNGTDWVALTSISCGISPPSLGPYTVGQVVSQTMTANNCGAGTLTWTSSALPAGLSGCNGVTGMTCVISGTLTTATSYIPTISVTDGGANSSTITPNVTVNTAPTITTTSPLVTGLVGTAYSQTLAASGGTLPLTWSQTAGTLPPGLSLSSSGILSGVPTSAAGSPYSFTFRVTDLNGITNSKAFSVTIQATGGTQGGTRSGGGKKNGKAVKR